MAISDTPYFSLIKNRLSFLNDRQKVLSNNVANSTTPRFTPQDLDEKSFKNSVAKLMPQSDGSIYSAQVAPVTLSATQSGHIVNNDGISSSSSKVVKAPDSETTLDGNSVVLEEQMIKVADTRQNYDLAVGLYEKGMQLMKLAAKKPS